MAAVYEGNDRVISGRQVLQGEFDDPVIFSQRLVERKVQSPFPKERQRELLSRLKEHGLTPVEAPGVPQADGLRRLFWASPELHLQALQVDPGARLVQKVHKELDVLARSQGTRIGVKAHFQRTALIEVSNGSRVGKAPCRQGKNYMADGRKTLRQGEDLSIHVSRDIFVVRPSRPHSLNDSGAAGGHDIIGATGPIPADRRKPEAAIPPVATYTSTLPRASMDCTRGRKASIVRSLAPACFATVSMARWAIPRARLGSFLRP